MTETWYDSYAKQMATILAGRGEGMTQVEILEELKLDPTVGAELKKTRPAVIANDDAIGILPLEMIVHITTGENYGEILYS